MLPPAQTEDELVMAPALAKGVTAIFTGSANETHDPLVTRALYQTVVVTFATVTVFPLIILAPVEVATVDQAGVALAAFEKLKLLCHCTVEPAELPFNVRVVLLVNTVATPFELSAVPGAQTVTSPPVIVPGARTIIVIVTVGAHCPALGVNV